VTASPPATHLTDAPTADRVEYLLRLADDALILSHRLTEWSSWAPQLEEDIALTNIALDLLGQARPLLTHAGDLEGAGRDEDDFAYLRQEHEFRSCALVEQPTRGDFAAAIAGLLLFSGYLVPLYEALTDSADPTLAAIAGKGIKEARYHLEHAAEWTIRLGDGTDESHERMQGALDRMWRYSGELFESDSVTLAMVAAGIGPDPQSLRTASDRTLDAVLSEATLTVPTTTPIAGTGRSGRHSEHLGYLLAEMQYLHRQHPGATW
jgi:ring-1,2-phenylacetyl-CoA epoxidase subunit PaaC